MKCDKTSDCSALIHQVGCQAVEEFIDYRLENRYQLDHGMGSDYDQCRNPDCRSPWHGTVKDAPAAPDRKCYGSHCWNDDGTPRKREGQP